MNNQQETKVENKDKGCPGEFTVLVARVLMEKLQAENLTDRERSLTNFVINNMVRNLSFNYCKCEWCMNLEISFEEFNEKESKND